MSRLRYAHLVPAFVLLAMATVPFASPLSAQEAAKKVCAASACFETSYDLDGKALPLKGVSLFEYWSFDVYSAALYADESINSIDGILGDVPKYLVLDYHRGLERQNIIDNSEYVLQENPDNNMNQLRDRLKVLYENYNEVKDGDRFSMSYLPGKGTTLYYNGKEKTTLPGVDFQKAYFGIWLSKKSVDEDFTRELLGR